MDTALLRMIGSQADALERMGGLDLAGPAAVLAQARRIVLVGTGTSLHAAELGAMMLTQAGRDAYAYPAAAWARWGAGPRATDVVCVITHTAEPAYAAGAREGALKIREAARMLAEGFDTDRLLHGGAVPYTAADTLVVLEPAADPDGLTGAVAAAARAENIPVAELAAPDSGLAPLLAQIPM